MYSVEVYAKVRRACHVEGMSIREASRRFGLHRSTIKKILGFALPPGYRRTKPVRRPKLEGFTGFIDAWLLEDKTRPKKQHHTAKRIFERLRGEHGFLGGYTIVKDYVQGERLSGREMFVPLFHPPGQAQVDFGEAVAVIGGVEQKAHFFVMDLPHSDAPFVKAYPAETSEAFCDATYLAQSNPFAWEDTTAAASGEVIYRGACEACHAADGSGALPAAPDFSTAEFQSELRSQGGESLCIVAEGRGAMPGWKETLTLEQIWQVLTFIASLGK